MLYKPNYCCNCGEKIERVDWNLLTSRRFCEVCSGELKRHDYIPRAAVAAGVLALMFGLGTLFGGRTEGNAPMQTQSVLPTQLKSKPEKPPTRIAEIPQERPQQQSQAQIQDQAPPASTKVFYCSALTKKGTPCSRKVKAAGLRCFQHQGKPAAASAAY